MALATKLQIPLELPRRLGLTPPDSDVPIITEKVKMRSCVLCAPNLLAGWSRNSIRVTAMAWRTDLFAIDRVAHGILLLVEVEF